MRNWPVNWIYVSDEIVVAGCCRLQLGAAHWATSVALLQVVVDKGPHEQW